MKTMKGRILKKLKSIPQVSYLKQGRVLHLSASDGFPPDSPPPLRDLNQIVIHQPEPEMIDVSELMRDLEDDEFDDKENIKPVPNSTQKKNKECTDEKKEEPFRRPDLESETLFDPDLLAAFEKAVMDHIKSYEQAKALALARKEDDPFQAEEPPSKIPRVDTEPLIELEERCPPGGRGAVILYTTSLRGIRKTFEDCSRVRYLLESSKVVFQERDVSMHMEFRDEMWRVLERRAIPPRLFVKGRYVGGVDEVVGLHEQGRLLPLLEGIAIERSSGAVCEGCAGMRFMVCFRCSGSRKVYGDEVASPVQCRHCNENGLIICPLCC